MLNISLRDIKWYAVVWVMLLPWRATLAATVTPAQQPLFLGISNVKPNIMLMVDNSGSMNDPVTITNKIDKPNAPGNFTYTCGNSTTVAGGSSTSPASTIVNMIVDTSGSPKFCNNPGCTNTTAFGNNPPFFIFPGQKCFNNDKYYNVSYNGGANLGSFLGKDLNWYFINGTFSQGSLSATSTTTDTRMNIAKEAAKNFIDALTPGTDSSPTMRMGLSTYNRGNGGLLLEEITEMDATKASKLKTEVGALIPDGSTPLAETLSDIGAYFATGNTTGKLTLHPDTTKTVATVDQVFNNHSFPNSTGLTGPIQHSCQKSTAVLITDGLPTEDRNISTDLADYDGDCSGPSNTGKCTSYDMKNLYNYGPLEYNSSDYLNDVAQALFEMDLRPDLTKKSALQKNNLVTYTIGLADPTVDPTKPGNNPLLSDTATKGGGLFFYAADSKALASALESAVQDMSVKPSSSSTVATNASQLNTNSAIYQGKYLSGVWTGSLLAYTIVQSEDVNRNGALDSGEDLNNNSVLDGGSIASQSWDAATKIPSFASRKIISYIPKTSSSAGKGVEFACTSLSATQKTSLGISSCTNNKDQGVWRLNYLRGDWSHENINPFRLGTDPIRSSDAADRIFRNRTLLDEKTRLPITPDPWVLGDIVNSNPVYVSQDDFGYTQLAGTEGSSYSTFRTSTSYLNRRNMIYVGANDGMLHGFDATPSSTSTQGGVEVFAYVPNSVFSNLSDLSDPSYIHEYFVDGPPRVADAYFGSTPSWHTVLVGTTGAGGKGVFALDVTDPDSFATTSVLWEITSGEVAPDGVAANKIEFANNLGFTISQASIARMANGKFAAIFSNGYGSTNNQAVLYIVDIANGSLLRAINTLAGSSTTPNGLSTPIAVDIDNDKIVDYVYAGDLLGNMWKFDVNDASPANWNVAYGTSSAPAPLFVACSINADPCPAANRQPITSKPQIGVGPTSGGYLVYFGTGKYFEDVDNNLTSAQVQTFYGILDNNATVAQRSNLQLQQITSETTKNGFNLRELTNNTVDYSTKKGWYLDLLKPSTTASDGERVISAPLLQGDRVVFSTMRPVPPAGSDPCGSDSQGISWLMEINALNGSRLDVQSPPFDISGDGVIDSKDLLANGYSPSGKQSDNGAHGTPSVIRNGRLEYKYTSGSKDGLLQVTTESASTSSTGMGRQSWRQLR